MTAHLPCSTRLVLFLDIDGVLHSEDAQLAGIDYVTEALRVGMVRGQVNPTALGLLCPHRQQLLADILARHEHVDVVLSSSWRHWEGFHYLDPNDMRDELFERRHVQSLDWIKRWMIPELAHRLIGKTPPNGSRLQQVRIAADALSRNGYSPYWVALDDQASHFPGIAPFYQENGHERVNNPNVAPEEIVVLVDGRFGLREVSALALDRALAHASQAANQHIPPLSAIGAGG
ncbi:hypothetical protein E4K72_10515 [Oxalobacteraceae bacterium OM1]|nr:hypothetical protein E4K72_10515 [Oxalobacteraceae bacterium OM1]